jgi:GGDEF domain-containing protein
VTTRNNGFAKKVQLELKRASRYRTFISLIIIDLSTMGALMDDSTMLEDITTAIRGNIRETDEAATLDGNRIGLLVPETSRQGAEIAARRIHEVVKGHVNGAAVTQNGTHPVRLEIASFPDAGGNRTVAEFIEELAGTETA